MSSLDFNPPDPHKSLRKNFAEWEAYSAGCVKEYAQFAIRSLLYINGGSLVVILALIGNMFHGQQGKNALQFAAHLRYSFDLFVLGMVFCVFAAGATYFNYTRLVVFWRHLRFSDSITLPPNPFSDPTIRWTRFSGIAFVILSGASFFAGCFASITALSTFNPA